jgi:hypothetical protein
LEQAIYLIKKHYDHYQIQTQNQPKILRMEEN